MRKFIYMTLLLTGCGSEATTLPPPALPPPALPLIRAYPQSIIVDCPVCDCICVAFSPSPGDVYCDSDCDGWFDRVENASPFLSTCSWDPPPAMPTNVCDLVFGRAQQPTIESAREQVKAQRLQDSGE